MSNDIGPNTYLDFNGLGQLKARAERDEQGALRQAAQQFEAYFLQEVLKSMRATVENGGLVDSSAMSTYEQMMDKEVAQQLAQGQGVGLADMLVSQFEQQHSAQAQLAQHPGASFALQRQAPAMSLDESRAMPLPKNELNRSLK